MTNTSDHYGKITLFTGKTGYVCRSCGAYVSRNSLRLHTENCERIARDKR